MFETRVTEKIRHNNIRTKKLKLTEHYMFLCYYVLESTAKGLAL